MDGFELPLVPPSKVPGSASYSWFLWAVIEDDHKSQIDREKVDSHYPKWLLKDKEWCGNRYSQLLDQSRSAYAERLWNDRRVARSGFAIRFSKTTWEWNKCEAVTTPVKNPKSVFTEEVKPGKWRSVPLKDVYSGLPSRDKVQGGSTNSIYDSCTQKVFNLPFYQYLPLEKLEFVTFVPKLFNANKEYCRMGIMVWIVVWRIFRGVIEIDYSFEPRAAMDRALASASDEAAKSCWDLLEGQHHGAKFGEGHDSAKEWVFDDMIMIPHCWHIPAINFDMLYNHSSLGVQVVNPYVVFTEKLMNTIWVKFFESRVQLKYIKPDFADTFVAKISLPRSRLYWEATAIADSILTPRHTSQPGQLFHPVDRMISVIQLSSGKLLCSPLSSENRNANDLFAGFTKRTELLNPGASRDEIVEAWKSLDWKETAVQYRIDWAAKQPFTRFAKTHWGSDVHDKALSEKAAHDKAARDEEAEAKRLTEGLKKAKGKQTKVLALTEADPRDFKQGKRAAPHKFKPGNGKVQKKRA